MEYPLLNRDSEEDIGEAVLSFLQGQGWLAEAAIPGLVFAINELAESTDDSSAVLDEAINLLN